MADSIVRMLVARVNGQPFPPPGVEDTRANRAMWEKIGADLARMREDGLIPEIPYEYADRERP